VTSGAARVAVVGAGWWSGSVHLPAIVDNPHAELVAICDADADRARAAAELFGARYWTTQVEDLATMGIDCAVVATPHDAHHGPVALLLDAGVDVLVEKPMAIHPRDAWDMVGRAERSGARLHVGYPFLHSAQAAALRGVVRDRGIGEPVLFEALFATAVQAFYRGDVSTQSGPGTPFVSRADTYSSASRGGGQLLSQATHAAAMALWCLEDSVEIVSGIAAGSGDSEVDDVDVVSARAAAGTLLSISSTGTVHENDARIERYTLLGTSGHAILDTVAGTLVVYRPSGVEEDLVNGTAGSANAVRAPIEALIAAKVAGGPVVVDGSLGARVVEVLWAANQSAASGRVVRPGDWAFGPAAGAETAVAR